MDFKLNSDLLLKTMVKKNQTFGLFASKNVRV